MEQKKPMLLLALVGGKNSTIAAALLVDALGADRVVGVLMPNNKQSDIKDSYRVCKKLGIDYREIDIGSICSAFYNVIPGANERIIYNTLRRIRMTVLYAVAAEIGGRVCNTSNRSEILMGHNTKWGNNVGDFSLFDKLCVRDVLSLGEWYVQRGFLSRDLVYKVPVDGLIDKTNEENMSLTYEIIDNYILDNIFPDSNKDFINLQHCLDRNEHRDASVCLPAPSRCPLSQSSSESLTRRMFFD